MSETSDTHPLVQRLVVDRVAGPGVLDRRALERTHARFSQPSRLHTLDRLQRRVAAASASAEILPLVRVDRSVGPETAARTSRRDPVTSVPMSVASVARAERPLNVVSAVVSRPIAHSSAGIARSTAPGIAPVNALITRRTIAAPSVSSDARTIARSASPGDAPTIAARAVTQELVQRQAESRDTPRAGAGGELVTAMPLSASAVQAMPLPVRGSSPASPAAVIAPARAPRESVTSTPLARVAPTTDKRAPSPILWRKADPARSPSIAGATPVISTSPAVPAASTQLLLRMPEVAATHASSSPPSVASTMNAFPREAAPSAHVSATPDDIDIDWIAEQVGNRLARRLEIERERLGVRQWRQAN